MWKYLISVVLCITRYSMITSNDLTDEKLHYHIVLTGLDGSGKTTIFNQLTQGTIKETVPTIGFNADEIAYKNFSFSIWDVGGQRLHRPLWRHYIHKESPVIFVVDSTDVERLKESKTELHCLVHHLEMQNTITILLNKQDLPDGISIADAEVIEQLQLSKLVQNWHVLGTSAIRGDGLNDILEHIYQLLINKTMIN